MSQFEPVAAEIDKSEVQFSGSTKRYQSPLKQCADSMFWQQVSQTDLTTFSQ